MSAQTTRYEPQHRDGQECGNWAVKQMGSDTDSKGNLRAKAACLVGHG
jgi:hypothetical protein